MSMALPVLSKCDWVKEHSIQLHLIISLAPFSDGAVITFCTDKDSEGRGKMTFKNHDLPPRTIMEHRSTGKCPFTNVWWADLPQSKSGWLPPFISQKEEFVAAIAFSVLTWWSHTGVIIDTFTTTDQPVLICRREKSDLPGPNAPTVFLPKTAVPPYLSTFLLAAGHMLIPPGSALAPITFHSNTNSMLVLLPQTATCLCGSHCTDFCTDRCYDMVTCLPSPWDSNFFKG